MEARSSKKRLDLTNGRARRRRRCWTGRDSCRIRKMETQTHDVCVERGGEPSSSRRSSRQEKQARSGSCGRSSELGLGKEVRYLADTGANFLSRPVIS